jgi:hypothetical protein
MDLVRSYTRLNMALTMEIIIKVYPLPASWANLHHDRSKQKVRAFLLRLEPDKRATYLTKALRSNCLRSCSRRNLLDPCRPFSATFGSWRES